MPSWNACVVAVSFKCYLELWMQYLYVYVGGGQTFKNIFANAISNKTLFFFFLPFIKSFLIQNIPSPVLAVN